MVQWFRWISFLSSVLVWAPGVVVIMLLFNLLSFCYHEIKYFCCLKRCLVELKLAACFLLSKPESWLTKHGKNVTKKIKNVFDKIVVIFITLIRLIFWRLHFTSINFREIRLFCQISENLLLQNLSYSICPKNIHAKFLSSVFFRTV